MDSSESDMSGFETPPETVVIIPDPADNQDDIGLQSQELTFFRRTLRILSLWHPTQAWLVEKIFYPILVNILLLLLVASDVYMMANGDWKSLDVYVYFGIDLGMYLSHIFGVLYFRSRDLEANMLNVRLNNNLDVNELRKKLRRLKLGIICSYFSLVVLVLLFFNTKVWLHGRLQCNSVFTFLEGVANHLVCGLNYPTNIYGIGNSLALSWTICLLQQTCFVRLQQLSRNYLRWTGSTEDAIYDHLTNYARKVKASCSHLEMWFFTHNIILMLATPFLISDIIKEFQQIREKDPIHAGLFLGFLIYTMVVWVAPLYFAEQLQIHDENLCSSVNEFCPGTFEELEPELHAQLLNLPSSNQPSYVFRSRAEVNKFLSYLKNRKSGFLIGSYSFQFKLSMVSVLLGLTAFATRVIG